MDNKAATKQEGRARRLERLESEAPQAVKFSAGVTRPREAAARQAARAEKEGAKAPTAARPPASVTKSGPMKAVQSGIGRYLETLGLGPNATLDAINTTYYTLLKRFPENPTEADEARLQGVKRAYEILRRNYQPKEAKRPLFAVDKRTALPLLGLAAAVMLAGLVALNWKALRLKMVHYGNGTVVALKSQSEPYGQIVGYEPVHRFPAGNPSSAYELKLAGTETTVWVSERLVVNGMKPLGGK